MNENNIISINPTEATESKEWANITPPGGYLLTEQGVFEEQKAGPVMICGPVWVEALTRDHNGTGWGMVVCWIDRDGRKQNKAISNHLLHETGGGLAIILSHGGLMVVPREERKVAHYLGCFEPENRLLCVSQVGWVESSNQLVYVRPDGVLSKDKTDEIIFQPEQHAPTVDTMKSKGSLALWQQHVAEPCKGNPYLVFSVCASFAAVIQRFVGSDNSGFHLYGNSSRGKTTALQVAASVHGCGADPGGAAETYLLRWNATQNAMEGLAAAHNDGLLVLDEIGSCPAYDFGRTVYDLSGGQGKSRMNKNAVLNKQRRFRVLTLSSGEYSVRQKIEEVGKQVKAGQMNRFLDIPIEDAIVIETHDENPADFVNRVKRNCGEYYGTAGPAFIQAILDKYGQEEVVRSRMQQYIEEWVDMLMQNLSLEPAQARAMGRLAPVGAAGQMAIELGIVPLEAADIQCAVETIRDAWLTDEFNMSDEIRGALNVRAFILKNPDRFGSADFPVEKVRQLAGYFHAEERWYLFTPEGFAEACGGIPEKAVAKALRSRRLLHTNNSGHLKSRLSIPGLAERLEVYAVRQAILESDSLPLSKG
ncbi:MAG: DUF927 domain-containing protein [Candidatus Thiodiazotropha taylori]|nr:DUF927 domain-containing protein [Candidatus Thiodiazotropha taylori]MCW4325479.1 DUF927 domain-containing protein [Candidatus Thiodiazotropha taylori]